MTSFYMYILNFKRSSLSDDMAQIKFAISLQPKYVSQKPCKRTCYNCCTLPVCWSLLCFKRACHIWSMLTDVAFREFYICEVGLLLLMINKAWSLLWQWKEAQSNYSILDHMTRFALLTTIYGVYNYIYIILIKNILGTNSSRWLLLNRWIRCNIGNNINCVGSYRNTRDSETSPKGVRILPN